LKTVGVDIGGANLKVADSDGYATSCVFELWKHPDSLAEALAEQFEPLRPFDVVGVTMTGELADCYASKAEGVDRILSAIEHAAEETPVAVWQTGGEFTSSELARELAILVSAANWHALATWLGRLVPEGRSLLIDIGSTTSDLIPLEDGRPSQIGMTDTERLLNHELIYTGVRRTPVATVVGSVPVDGVDCPVAAELFATMADVYLLTGDLIADEGDLDTADGRPLTRVHSLQRLARMVCADSSELSITAIEAIAQFVADVQQQRLRQSIDALKARSNAPISNILISGSGRFLARRMIAAHPELSSSGLQDLSTIFSPAWADAACACAMAQLALERFG